MAKQIFRDDISDQVIHFTKPAAETAPDKFLEGALEVFDKIVSAKFLLGGNGFIKGSYKCVCFTEAPLGKLPILFANRKNLEVRYAPYGFMFGKKWLFAKGARPAIYGEDNDFDILPEKMKFRHVKYHLGDDYITDHTWEREWRLRADRLDFTPDDVTLVVPHRAIVEYFREEYKSDNWHFIALSDLGIPIDSIEG